MASNEVTAFIFTVRCHFWSKKSIFFPLVTLFPAYIEFPKARKEHQAHEATSVALRKKPSISKNNFFFTSDHFTSDVKIENLVGQR